MNNLIKFPYENVKIVRSIEFKNKNQGIKKNQVSRTFDISYNRNSFVGFIEPVDIPTTNLCLRNYLFLSGTQISPDQLGELYFSEYRVNYKGFIIEELIIQEGNELRSNTYLEVSQNNLNLKNLSLVQLPTELKEKINAQFIDTASDHYQEYCKGKEGYFLWSCLDENTNHLYLTITEFENKTRPAFGDDEVFVFWDIYHLGSKLRDFGRNQIIRIKLDFLLDNVNSFPNGLYIYHEKERWFAALTHEEIDSGGRNVIFTMASYQ